MDAAVAHVSLAPQRRALDASPCAPLLDARGAQAVLGGSDDAAGLAVPVVPSATSLFGPRGACVAADGTLWIADTGHHRLLGWRQVPEHDGTPADWLIGQPAFDREGRNARGEVGAATLNVPTGLCACGDGLAVADAWNHRVLIWHRRPTCSQQPADVVLGQPDFDGCDANRGAAAPEADTLFWPYGVAWDGERLWVADTGNRRVLRWDRLPVRHGEPADGVLGQTDFRHRDENAGGAATAASLRWPHAIAFPAGGLAVADAGNNRVMFWPQPPTQDFQPCDALLGQADASSVEHNRGHYLPDAASLNMPYGLASDGARLIVADTANSRLLAWRLDALHGSAQALAGQHDWQAKGDNRWQPASRDSVCWPYSVALHGDTALIADSGNNRVLLWRLHRP